VKWTETLWNDLSNVPVSTATTNVTRRALISYSVDTADWYSSSIDFDISGFIFYPNDTVPACKFNPAVYQKLVSPRLDGLDPTNSANITQLKTDFLANGFNNGNGNPCPDVLPNYIFSAADYALANSTVNTTYNNNGKGPLNAAGAVSYYVNTGMGRDDIIRASKAIPALAAPVTIQQPMPANSALDTGDDTCPNTNCEDLNVLFTLADQYNQDPTQPGIILRVTRAFTPNPNQCDVEVDMNYDTQVQDTTGKTVKKGSFTLNDAGSQIPVTTTIPSGVSKGEKRAMTVHVDQNTCAYVLDQTDPAGSGNTIQSNTPALYRPMEYATQFQQANQTNLSNPINQIVSAISDAAQSATSILTTYRTNTYEAAGNIAYLGNCPSATCGSTANLNAMLAFYKKLNCGEVYAIGGYNYTPATAADKCATYGGTLATLSQLTAAQAAGADWCSTGFLADMLGKSYWPINTPRDGCGSSAGIQQWTPESGLAGANCYGVKPKQGLYADVLPFKTGGAWNQPNACSQAYMGGAVNYVNPTKEAFTNYGKPIQVTDTSFPANINAFGLDLARNKDGPGLDAMFKDPLRQDTKPLVNPKDVPYMPTKEEVAPRGKTAYKFLRFRPIRTRYPTNPTVDVSKFRFFFGKHEIDMETTKVTNPMGTWIGDVEDVTGPGYTTGWADAHKKAIVFAFPHATLVDGFTWTTANPDKGLGGDPVQWKLEGSTNGVYWTILRDQTHHNFPVSETRFQELPVFRF